MTRSAASPPLVDDPERGRIRHDLATTLIVEAAAGTGKTTELIRRIVEVIATGAAAVDQIVAVTFTEKAAGELKLRLREAFEEARNAARFQRDSAVRTRRLEQALTHLEEARVGTIHAFCAELLRERPVEARIDPKFEVLLEGEAERLFGEVFDLWLQQQLEHPPDGVRRSIRRTTAFGDEDGEPTARLRLAAWRLVEWRDFPTAWRRDPFDRTGTIDAVVEQLHDVAALTEDPARPRDNLHGDTRILRQASRAIRAAERVRARDYDGLEADIVSWSSLRAFKSVRKGSGSTYKEGVARHDVLAAHADLIARMEGFARDADADLAALLQGELADVLDRYRKAKQQTGRVDFVDLLLRARDLLRDNAGVLDDFRERISHLFVDEFQDTDPLQAEILLMLAADVPGKLFIVGDPKQSIYRFRRADVGTYEAVKRRLEAQGAECLTLRTSFRSVASLQRFVNAAFSPVMTGNTDLLQADYVPLSRFRADHDGCPSVVALPVPAPYGFRRVAMAPIEASLPDAVGAFIAWLVSDSQWSIPAETRKAGSAEASEPVPVRPRDICILFRRFEKFGTDMTRPYVQALEARGIPHLLVGGKSFHQREEVETMRAALAAIEWPDDELSVFATLRGSLFAIPDERLLEYRSRWSRLHPFRIPQELDGPASAAGVDPTLGPREPGHEVQQDPGLLRGRHQEEPAPDMEEAHLAPIVDALRLLATLHRRRNHVPVTETIGRLLDATRAHAGFVMRPSGEQVLANVLQIAELARRYEVSGGISFRGFVEQLRQEAEAAAVGEAPILEEGSDGVRLMTVHKAKGLEFPVVILADITANLAHRHAGRYIDPDRQLCALRLAGWSPVDLLDHEAREVARDGAEGLRVAYVAATRARDLLVVPAIGDGPYDDKWISVLNPAIYPPRDRRRSPAPPPGGLQFGKDTVLERPNGDPATPDTVAPGVHEFPVSMPATTPDADGETDVRSEPRAGTVQEGYSVVWWDPRHLDLEAPERFGIRQQDLLAKDTSREIIDADLRTYHTWRDTRAAALAAGSRPSLVVQTVTERAAQATERAATQDGTPRSEQPDVEILEVVRDLDRPSGPRFGALVHAVLAIVPLDADVPAVEALATTQGRVLGATQEEASATALLVLQFLRHPLADRARRAQAAGRLYREVPLAWIDGGGTIVEGTADLALQEDAGWLVVDFKTDREVDLPAYRNQVLSYARALAEICGAPVRAALVAL